jgi:SAM-dependent MidA family methyltransferase
VFVDADRREVMVPAAAESAAEAARVAPDAPPGARVPLQHVAAAWLRAALGVLGRGRVVVVDYASTSASMATRPAGEWLRTYAGHGRGRSPLEHLGRQDITCEVAVDQLAHVRPPDVDRSQSEFLRAAGLGELVEKARAAWEARAHVGDLEAVRARSRVAEGAALTDESGLGAFRVLEWDAGR